MPRSHVILVTTRHVALAEIRGKRTEVTFWPRSAAGDYVEAIESVLSQRSGKLGPTWILAAELWSQAVTLQADVVQRLPAAELPQFLGFEVEPLSGLQSSEARLGLSELSRADGEVTYWVSETPVAAIDRLTAAVSARGGRLAGVLHPAGPAQSIRQPPPSAGPWRRKEIWPDLTVGLAFDPVRGLRREIWGRSSSNAAPQVEIERWLAQSASAGPLELVDGSGFAVDSFPKEAPAARIDLEQEADVRCWLAVWAAALSHRVDVPIIVPPRKTLPLRTKRFLAGGLAATVLIGCVAHRQAAGWWNARAAQQLGQEIVAAQSAIDAEKDLTSSIEKQRAALKTLADDTQTLKQEVEQHQQVLAGHRQRIPQLLRTLAEESSEELLIRRIESDDRELRIVGACLDPRQANRLAEALARELSPLGLSVSMPSREAQYRLQGGGPYEFELAIADRVETSPPATFSTPPND